jgi:uncharacterized protein YndB with AHSA1/START domain
MFARDESVHIDASPDAVYDYVSDISRHPEWAKQKLVMRPLGDGRFESHMAMGPLKARAVIHVEVAERPRRFVYVADDDVSGPHRWHFDISPDANGSEVRFGLERMHETFPFTLMQPLLLFPLIGHPGMRTGLARIKARIERPQESPSAATTGA